MPVPADRIARLRLIRSDNIGPVTYFQLLARFGSAQAPRSTAIPDLARARRRAGTQASPARPRSSARSRRSTRLGARYLFLGRGASIRALLAELEIGAAGA